MKKVLICGLVLWAGVNAWAEDVAPAPTPEPEPTVINERYEMVNDGAEIRDLKTTLVWQRCSVGQTWEEKRCMGQSKELTFDQAQRLSGNEWRVPTIDELATLVEPNPDPKLRKMNPKAFPGTEGWFWTSNTPEPDSLVGSFLNFYNGYTVSARKNSANHVYLVRTNGVRYVN